MITAKMKHVLISLLILLWAINCSRNQDLRLRVIVEGKVVDENSSPVAGATVQARLGLDLNGSFVLTGEDGSFVAESTSKFWSKGRPSTTVKAFGYEESWTYFDSWDRGERRFERTIVLQKAKEKETD